MVIVEGSCIAVRKDAVLENYQGGMAQFLFDIPDYKTLSQDIYLMSFSFKDYHQAKSQYFFIAKKGLKFTDFIPDISYEKIDAINRVGIAQSSHEEDDYFETDSMRRAKIGVPKNWEYEKSVTQMLQYQRMNKFKSFLNH